MKQTAQNAEYDIDLVDTSIDTGTIWKKSYVATSLFVYVIDNTEYRADLVRTNNFASYRWIRQIQKRILI